MTNKSLDKDGLMLYIKETFPGTIDNHWTSDMLENIIDYGMEIFPDCSIIDFSLLPLFHASLTANLLRSGRM